MFNMEEFQDDYTKWEKPHKKVRTVWLYFYKIPKYAG